MEKKYTKEQLLDFTSFVLRHRLYYFTINELFKVWTGKIELKVILRTICEILEIKNSEIKGKDRKQDFIIARQIFCYLAKKYTNKRLSKIGGIINRTHSLVYYHINQAKKYNETEKSFILKLLKCEDEINKLKK